MKHRFIGLLSAAHLCTDLNQGALPAILPFLMSSHSLNYAQAAGLVFAASFVSSIIQPLFGYFADKISKPWLMPGGLFLAGAGLACIGFLSSYWAVFFAVAVSGIGIAAFHPEAARIANQVSGEKKGTGVSIFSVGGNGGFALGPVIATAALLVWGIKGTFVLLIPCVLMSVYLFAQIPRLQVEQAVAQVKTSTSPAPANQWIPFYKLTFVVFCRSIIFYGLNTFLPLYWIGFFHQSAAVSGTVLTILFSAGVVGTLLGGRMADKFGYHKVIQFGFVLLWPLLLFFLATENLMLATFLLVPIGFALFASASPLVVLGQKYLPNRMGFASGITLGLAVSVGGIATPLLGWLADHYGLRSAFYLLAALPLLALLQSFALPVPELDRDRA
ncbi:MFS transporter|uniref:MFS transporter, FSR family, fosmidomycin resistance protein n=1 Tax=Dendrosporobacter quercicolus TaxID=146817 RepID=A0A1G9S2P4_9FIRM|nr:MFS transporter [Dendrosporobacter quercicolus]NSL49490.1 MFS transporter [Dendrosporobacter quercicolus DSM 1736]SDM29537.1 MFS transporter, FSR family, fosmidomycin resistance protein [Dendrosporobacter quercicolus]